MSSLQSRVLVAVIGVPVLVYVVLWAPSAVMMAALCVLAGIGGLELQRCVSAQVPASKSEAEMIGISVLLPCFIVIWHERELTEWIPLLFLIVGIGTFCFAIVKGGEIKFHQIMAAIFGGGAIGYSFSGFLRMEEAGIHRAYLLLPFILSFACDTFAYFAGRAFGKHKLAPKVSPNKTIEGSIGGMLGNVVCGLLFVFVMDTCFDAGIGYGLMMILSLLCGIVAQIGDLSFSLIKREFGIKDYGRLFLEHGGVLDRFDSVLFVTPVVEVILRLSLLLE